jgi:hypothetical protein
MKIRLLLALSGVAISLALPTFAQQEDTVDPQSRQELEAVDAKLDQAIDKNDAAAAAALFTEDAILMLPLEFAPEQSGIFSGRPAIEKWYTQKFTEYHVTTGTVTRKLAGYLIPTSHSKVAVIRTWLFNANESGSTNSSTERPQTANVMLFQHPQKLFRRSLAASFADCEAQTKL